MKPIVAICAVFAMQIACLGAQDAQVTTTTVAPSQQPAGPAPQGPPPAPQPINCADYHCRDQVKASSDPMQVREGVLNVSTLSDACKSKLVPVGRSCNLGAGNTCYGYCLNIDQGKDYCICDYAKVDRQCAIDKPGKCEKATGQLPANVYQADNKRFKNKSDPDNGDIYGRHFAASFDDCVKLCQWTGGLCRSVNFGTLAGQNVCELLSVAVEKRGLLESWLVNEQGWKYAVVPVNQRKLK